MNETRDVVGPCLQLLALRGVFAWRNNTTGVFDPVKKIFRKFTGLKGVSDILGCLPDGRFLAIECKVPGNKPTPDQAAFLEMVAKNNGVALVINDVRELDKALDTILGRRR